MPRYAFWKIDPYAPAAQVDIRRKPQQCQRVHMLWISNKHKSQSAEKFLVSNDQSNERAQEPTVCSKVLMSNDLSNKQSVQMEYKKDGRRM